MTSSPSYNTQTKLSESSKKFAYTTSSYKYSSYNGDSFKEHYVHRQNFVELLYENTWWLFTTPCTCGGLGCTPCLSIPWCMVNIKCLCCEDLCQSDGCWSTLGLCNYACKSCCCVGHFACPPRGAVRGTGVPICAFCDHRTYQPSSERGWKSLIEDADLLDKSFILCYFWCCGIGLAEFHDLFCRQLCKVGCCRNHCFTTDPCPEDRDCAFNHCKTFCCVAAMTYPSLGGEKDGIPGCAVCNRVCCCPTAPLFEARPWYTGNQTIPGLNAGSPRKTPRKPDQEAPADQ